MLIKESLQYSQYIPVINVIHPHVGFNKIAGFAPHAGYIRAGELVDAS